MPQRFPTDRSGFTLVEMIVVVVVIGVLATIAVPRFANAFRESRRAEADPMLRQIFTLQERFRARTGAYAVEIAELEGGASIPDAGRFFVYRIVPHPSGFCAVADPTPEGVDAGLEPKSLDAARQFHRSADCS